MIESSDDEYLEDFGAPALTEAELAEILVHARESGNLPLRLLVKQHATLRRAAAALLAHVGEASDVAAVRGGEAARLLGFLVASDGTS